MTAQENIEPLSRDERSQTEAGPVSPSQARENWPPHKKVARQVAAYASLTLGVAGLALPILPGIPFLILGVSLLGRDHPIAKPIFRLIDRARRKGRPSDTSKR